jgi:hypothetical protein
MKNHFRRGATRIVVLCALLASCLFGVTNRVAYSWDDGDFFNAQAACDNNAYTSTLEACRSSQNYPVDPTENDCRAQAGIAFGSCLDNIPSPSYSLDFCSMARARRDACANIYGANAQPLPDFPAYGECYDASGVSACE